jgi:hypothetical protein
MSYLSPWKYRAMPLATTPTYSPLAATRLSVRRAEVVAATLIRKIGGSIAGIARVQAISVARDVTEAGKSH